MRPSVAREGPSGPVPVLVTRRPTSSVTACAAVFYSRKAFETVQCYGKGGRPNLENGQSYVCSPRGK